METFINQFESFYLSNNIPLDKKTKISSLNNINNELPIFHRYLGLIFFVEDIKKFYTFKNNINLPELLISDNLLINTFGIYVENYYDIPQELSNFEQLGKIIFIFPLNVAYYYDGNTWNYFSGIYNIRTNIDLNNLNDNLKFLGCKVNKDNKIYIWNEDKLLSELYSNTINSQNLIKYNNLNQPIENKIYIHRTQIHEVKNNKIYKIGTTNKIFENFTINNGETKIFEILFSELGENILPPYINAILWINNQVNINSSDEVLIPINLSIFYVKKSDKFEIYANSDDNYNGTLEINY